jgi:hypothetical protein
MKSLNVIFIVIAVLVSCNTNKSVQKDLVSGLLTKGDGLSCDNIYLSVNDQKTNKSTFVYGQKLKMNFDNIKGFKEENGNVFPGMQIFITGKSGDTLLQSGDLYQMYDNGLNLSPLLLHADLTVATPISSDGDYTMFVNIWDKKGKGKFKGELDFKVVSNDKLKVDTEGVTFDEIYLFSNDRDAVITDNKIKFNENTSLIFEGLTGFMEENELVFPGMSLIARDNDNNTILEYDDLFAEYITQGISVSDFYSGVSSYFTLEPGDLKVPLHFAVSVWDKKSEARISVETDLYVE